MYQDSYCECNVKRQTPAFIKFLSGLMIALCVITLIAGFIVFPMLIVFLILLVMTYFFLLNADLEYEYLYVSGEIDFDVIKWQRARKRLLELNLDNVTVIAPENDDAAKAYSGRKLKSLDYSSNTGSERYLIAFKESGMPEETLIYFEPDEDLINILKAAAPNKVHVK